MDLASPDSPLVWKQAKKGVPYAAGATILETNKKVPMLISSQEKCSPTFIGRWGDPKHL